MVFLGQGLTREVSAWCSGSALVSASEDPGEGGLATGSVLSGIHSVLSHKASPCSRRE